VSSADTNVVTCIERFSAVSKVPLLLVLN